MERRKSRKIKLGNTTLGGDGEGLLFKKGQILRKVPEDQLLTELMKEIDKL